VSGSSSPDDLDALLLGGPRRYTRDEAVERAGVELERARAYWRALGFTDAGDAVAFTDADVEALREVVAIVEDGLLTEELALGLARALGHTLGRLAGWELDVVLDQLAGPPGALSESGRPPVSLTEAYGVAEQLLPVLEDLLTYVWRRQLTATVDRLLRAGEPQASVRVRTVGFADIVGFTRLARRLEERELGEVVERFEQLGADVVTAAGARLVKTLGDEVLFVSDQPAAAARAALDLIEHFAEDESMPDLRIGLATGPVLTRMGDLYGTTVNLASRLTALARPGTVLCDRETADELGEEPGLAAVALRRRPVRGLGLVEPHALNRSPWRTDPTPMAGG
jgi:adenylate cyclase